MSNAVALIRGEGLSRYYDDGLVTALEQVEIELFTGEAVALHGPSGCGKSTLLRILGAIERPSAGHVTVAGRPISAIGPAHQYRAQWVGFVFQMPSLLSHLTLSENVELPLVGLGVGRSERRKRADALLAQVGLSHRAAFTPNRVSGGERQRAAIARALATKPPVLLCDEPTGSLDSDNGRRILDLLIGLRDEVGVALLIATHDPSVSQRADRVVRMRDGRID